MLYSTSGEPIPSSGSFSEENVAPCRPTGPRRRRAATAMEYLFVISLILVVAISAIGSFGQHTKNTTQGAADAITNATTGHGR